MISLPEVTDVAVCRRFFRSSKCEMESHFISYL